MPVEFYQVDAFTDKPFAGNPAGVCILAEPRNDEWMQSVAREMNVSETAFLLRQEDGYSLRWFTPAVEVDLCGHGTLASCHVLWETGRLASDEQVRFHSRSGLLTAVHRGNEAVLSFPTTPVEPTDAPPGLAQALGAAPATVGMSKFDYLIEVDSEDTVRNLQPDMDFLRALPARGLIVTSVATTPGYDFVSRFFGPAVGVDEDPVTGSAHCALAPYWNERLGKQEFVAYQASARGGVLHVRLAGDRVFISGQAITVLRGTLTAD